MTVTVEKNGRELLAKKAVAVSYLRSFAGRMEVTALQDDSVENGDRLTLKENGVTVFSGRVFNLKNDGLLMTALCYDDKRYLLYQDSKVFSEESLAERVKAMLQERGLPAGGIAGGDVAVFAGVYDGKSGLVMIEDALDQAAEQGRYFAFYSREGKLCLAERKELVLDKTLTGKSLLFCEMERDIAEETYNRVQISRKRYKSGKRDHFVAEDAKNIAKWGKLSFHQTARQKDEDGYLTELAKSILKEKNKERQTVYGKAVGEPLLFAGATVRLQTDTADGSFWLTEVTHSFGENGYTVQFYGEEWQP